MTKTVKPNEDNDLMFYADIKKDNVEYIQYLKKSKQDHDELINESKYDRDELEYFTD